ncbi:small RNA 2'-O-methyltransferase-like [Malania oleifera]|uniref:small RNA 2'-O-methyltransferase-like n=1 Tax=Malania oleifera TaxID=397392 RepID=UPI0025AE1E5A|nr:small RNA 2'-O-methyltransferase-like [Malania oleifera]
MQLETHEQEEAAAGSCTGEDDQRWWVGVQQVLAAGVGCCRRWELVMKKPRVQKMAASKKMQIKQKGDEGAATLTVREALEPKNKKHAALWRHTNKKKQQQVAALEKMTSAGGWACSRCWLQLLSTLHSLSGHFRAVLQREGDLSGSIPVSVMAIYDAKLCSLCKSIDPMVEANPLLAVQLIMKAAARLPGFIVSSEIFSEQASFMTQQCWFLQQPNMTRKGDCTSRHGESLWFIECLLSGESCQSDKGSNNGKMDTVGFEMPLVDRNSAMSKVLYFYKNFLHRMLINKMPSGVYKLSREAILAADLPVAFTTRTNWRGSSPRDLLCTFCRQHHLSEPVFSPINNPLKSLVDSLGSCRRLKVEEPGKEGTEYANGNGVAASDRELVAPGSTFKFEVKIYSKCQNLIVHCLSKDSYKKQADTVQSTALKLLSWLNTFFKEPDMPLEKLTSSGYALNIRFNRQNFFKEFALCPSVHNVWQRTVTEEIRSLDSDCFNQPCIEQGVGVGLLNIEGQDSGVSPSSGSLVCINYTISLVRKGENAKELLESNDDFEFEIGTGAVIPQLEAGVIQLSKGQCACLHTELCPEEFILAAAGDSAKTLSLLSSMCCLEFSIILLKVTEPLEDRMEQAFFNPPLSKQQVEYALRHIKESSATTLIDFGCGSGSLLGSLLDYPTALEKIVGVDISQKSLIRAAKILHSKLSSDSDAELPNTRIGSAFLYERSITDVDSRFDIGTCLEVLGFLFSARTLRGLLGDAFNGFLLALPPHFDCTFLAFILIYSIESEEAEAEDQEAEAPPADQERRSRGGRSRSRGTSGESGVKKQKRKIKKQRHLRWIRSEEAEAEDQEAEAPPADQDKQVFSQWL